MFFTSWLRRARRAQPYRHPRPRTSVLGFERLEDRILLATWSGNVFDATPGTPLWTNTAVQEITGNVAVPTGQTLTVQAGTVVKFDAGTSLTVDGTLVAQGTPGQTIYFTSIQDGSVGGGSGSPGPGSWNDIVFTSTSTANVLVHTEIRYGGGNSSAAVVANTAPLMLSNTVISNSSSNGIRLSGSSPTLTADTFVSDGLNPFGTSNAAISMDLASQPVITGASFTNNFQNGVAVDGGSLPAGTTTWSNPSAVFALQGDITVPLGSTLALGAGQIVKIPGENNSKNNIVVNGTLSAQGTAAQPIVFTSTHDDSAGGDTNNDGISSGAAADWHDILFTSSSTGNVLDNVQVRYAGGSNGAAVIANGAPLTLSNSTISDSFADGLRLLGSNATLTGDTFLNSGLPFGGAAIHIDLASQPVITGASFANNRINGVAVDGGSLPAGITTWNNPEVVYWLYDPLTVPHGSTFAISAGQVVKVAGHNNSNDDLVVNGTLLAQGTASQPIIFTSYRDDSAGGDTNNDGTSSGGAADWHDILFTSSSTGNVLDNVQVRYAGAVNGAAVIANGAPLTLSNSTISDSFVDGLRLLGSNAKLTGDTFLNCGLPFGGAAIHIDLASQPVITGTSFANNRINGVAVDGGSLPAGITTWNNPDVVYWLSDPLTVPQGSTLTIGAGQVVKVAGHNNSNDDLVIDGTLLAQGTASQPILFTSFRDDSAGGDTNNDGNSSGAAADWHDLLFNSSSTGNVLDHVEMRYAGGGVNNGAIIDNGTALSLTNSTIRNTYGVAITAGIASNPTISDLTLTNNSTNGLEFNNTTLPGNTTWNFPGVVVVIPNTITVPAGVILTIAAGQIVKPNIAFGGDFLIVNGTLKAQGTLAQPIIITSYGDDTAGGDTNDNGPSTGSNGAVGSLDFTSTSTGSILDHVEDRYGRDSTSNLGMINVAGSTLTISNSVIGHSSHAGIAALAGSTVTVTDSLILDDSGSGLQGEAGSTLIAINDTIDGNLRGVILDSPTATLSNDLITNSTSDGIFQTGPTNLTLTFSAVFNPAANNYTGLTDQTGTNGNLEVDPKYFNEPGGQLQLRPGSPAEDAGTSAGAPATDFFGNPRFKDPNLPGRGDGSGYDLGAFEVEQTATSNVDLAASAVSGPATGLEDQSVTVNWTVTSVGAGTATGSWHDAVYLSASPVLTPDAILLQEVPHTGDLGPQASYNASAMVTLPGVTPGNYHFLVRANAENEVFEGTSLANNVAASATVAMTLPALTVGTPLTGALAATGLSELYQVTTTAGGNLNVTLTGASGNTNELYVSFGAVPTRQAFLVRGAALSSANQAVSLANVQAGTYYVLVYGTNVPSGENFTLTATTPGFALTSVSPAQASNTGQVTITISGAQFDGKSQPQLVDSAGATIKPLQVDYTDSGLVSATFDLTGLPTGAADVQVVNSGGATATLPHGFNVSAGQPGQLVTSLSAPSAVREGRSFAVTIDYSNVGDTDLLAPVLHLAVSSPGEISFSPDLSSVSTGLDLIAVNPAGPAGVLPPGAHGSLTVYATSTSTGTPTFQLTQGLYPAVPIDWAAAGALIRPAGLTDAFWTALLGQLQQDIGATWDAYQRVLARDTTLLPAGEGLNYSQKDVLKLEYLRALSILYPSVTGQVFLGDTSHPLGNVDIQLFDSTTNTAYDAVSLNDGSFLIPSVSAGTYDVHFGGFVSTGTTQLVVGSAGLANVQFVVAPGGRITGSVIEGPGGVPAQGLVVTAEAADGTTFTTATGLDGTYQLASLPAGVYGVQAGGGALSRALVSGVNVAAGGVSPNVDLVVQAAATLSGTVRGSGGPVSGAVVVALAADGSGFSAVTDATGAYTITGLSGQAYTLSASSPGLVTSKIDNVQPAAGGSLTGEDFTLTTGGSVTGRITQGAGGSAAPDVFLTLQGTAGTFSSQADTNGNYSVTGLPPGSYVLTTSSPNFMTVSTTVTVAAGAATTANLTTAPLGTVTGTVTNTATGLPLPNVIVQATQVAGEVTSALTDAHGSYQLVGLDAGAYQIVLGDEGTPGVAQTPVTLTPSTPTAVANLSIAAAGTLSGTVFGADGVTPVPAAQVSLLSAGVQVLTMSTDAQGRYVFVVLAAGTYELQASAVGLAFPSIEAVAVNGGAQQTGRNFQAGSAQITGVVQDGVSGQPIDASTVTIEQTNPGQAPVAVEELTTAAAGGFTLANAVPGVYRITASAGTYATATQTVTVTAGSPAQVVFKLTLQALLQGTIRDAATGVPLSGATVQLSSPSAPLVGANAVVDSAGVYQPGGVPPGSYQLLVQSPGYTSVLIGNVTLGAVPTILNVALAPATTTLSGTVTGAAGPLGGVTVIVTDANAVAWATTVTAANGAYAITSLPAGSYSVTALVPGYRAPAPVPVTVVAGQSIGGVNLFLTAVAITDAQLSAPADAAPHLPENWYNVVSSPNDRPSPGDNLSAGLKDALASCDNPKPYLVQQAQNLIYAANTAYFDYLDAKRAAQDVVSGLHTLEGNINQLGSVVRELAGLSSYDVNYPLSNVQGTTTPAHLSDVPGLLNQGIQELKEVFGDLLAGNADDAATHTGVPQLAKDLYVFTSVERYLRNLPLSSFGNHPVLYALRGHYADLLRTGFALAVTIDNQVTDAAIPGLATAQDFFAKNAAVTKAVDAAIAAIDQIVAQCDCSLGMTNGPVNLRSSASMPLAAPIVDEPGCMVDGGTEVLGASHPPSTTSAPPADDAPVVDSNSGDDESVAVEDAFDPNNLTGPAGSGPQAFIQPETMGYRVDFENDPAHATAAAQIVTTTFILDPNLAPSSFQFTGFGFGQHTFTVPTGLSHYQTTLDLRPDGVNLLVPVTLDENPATGVVTVEFQSLDPATMLPPDGINVGFLPVDDAAGDGEGYFTYSVQPKAGLPTGTAIKEQASIVFDTNAAISTPTALNTLDVGPPTSTVTALPATEGSSFTVSWSGQDDAGGSGIAFYNIYVSDNGGAVTPFLTGTTQTSATFSGVAGHTYAFYSVATDNVGNVQPTPTAAQATTLVPFASTTTLASDHAQGATYGQTVTVTTTVSAASGTPAGSVQFTVDGTAFGAPVALANGSASIALPSLTAGSHNISATFTSTVTTIGGSTPVNPLTEAVAPAPLTITADNQTKVYGAPLPALTVHYSGFVNGDTAASLTTAPTIMATATAASGVGSYPIMATGAVDPNYTLTVVPGTLSVTPAPLTVTVDNQTKVYGAALPALTVHYSGFINGDTAASLTTAPTITTTATAASGVNTYPITAKGAVDPNYTIAFVPGTLTVTPVPLTVTADNQSMVYGAGLPALTVHYSGFVNGDTAGSLTAAPTIATTASAASGVGSYSITATGAADTNYTIAVVPGTLTITPAPLTIIANNQKGVAGSALPALTIAYSGFVNGDSAGSLTPSAQATTTARTTSGAGRYQISVSGAADANYTITFVSGTLTLAAPPLLLTAARQLKAKGLAATFKGHLSLSDTTAHALLKLHLSTTLGKLQLHAAGVKVTGNNTRSVSLTGSASAVNRALSSLTLHFSKAHSKAKITIAVSDGKHSQQATITVS
jgi:hypothetical protein